MKHCASCTCQAGGRASGFVSARDEFVKSWERQYGQRYPFTPKDGTQLSKLLKASPHVVAGWLDTVARYLADPWHGQNGRHGLSALCVNIVRYVGETPKAEPAAPVVPAATQLARAAADDTAKVLARMHVPEERRATREQLEMLRRTR